MTEDHSLSDLLRFAIQTVGRSAIPAERLSEIVSKNRRMVEAYNLCDGSRTQTEVQRKTGVDSGNFARTVARWVTEGVLCKVRDASGKEVRLLHIYPMSNASKVNKAPKGSSRRR